MSSSLRPDAPCFVPASFLKRSEGEASARGYVTKPQKLKQRKAPRQKNEKQSHPTKTRSRRGEHQLLARESDNSSIRRTTDQFTKGRGNKGQGNGRNRERRRRNIRDRKKSIRVRTESATEPVIRNEGGEAPPCQATVSVTNHPLEFPPLGSLSSVLVEDSPSAWGQSRIFKDIKFEAPAPGDGSRKNAVLAAVPNDGISAFTVLVSKRPSRRTHATNTARRSEHDTYDSVADNVSMKLTSFANETESVPSPAPPDIKSRSNAALSLPVSSSLQPPLASKRYNMSRLRDRWWDLIKNLPHPPPPPHQNSTRTGATATEKHEELICANDKLTNVEHFSPVQLNSSAPTCQYEKKECLNKPLEPHYTGAKNPILEAIRRNDIEALQILMNKTANDNEYNGADTDEVGNDTDDDMSAIQLATHLDRPILLRRLISWARKGSILLKENAKFPPALFMAAEHGYEECLQLLIALGPSWLITRENFGNNILHIACGEDVPSSVLELVLYSAGGSLVKLLTFTNHRRQNPMHVACSNGRVDLVDMLLSTCSFAHLSKALLVQDKEKQTPLLAAVDAGAVDVVMSLLMWRGNNSLSTTNAGAPCPLTWAVHGKQIEMVQLLLEFNDPTGGGYDLTSALRRAVIDRTTSTDSSRDIMLTIVRVLVSSGANPCCNTLGNNTSAVEIGVEQYDTEVICVLLDSYEGYLEQLRRKRRRDPVLQQQPESFFAGLESKENAERTVALRSALVLSLFYCLSRTSHLVQQFYSCAMALYRRGACLSYLGLSNLCSSLARGSYEPVAADAIALSRSSLWHFEARYNHVVGPVQHPVGKDVALSYWSRVLRTQPFALIDIGCSWWNDQTSISNKSVPTLEDEMFPKADFVLIARDGGRFETHSTIICQKSEKLRAAFHFISMGLQQRDNSSDDDSEDRNKCVETRVDLSSQMCLWLLHHIYHGSLPSRVWSIDSLDNCVCENLLELLVIGEEFICPSLIQECEVRLLLSADEEQGCCCWHCCLRTGPIEDGRVACLYRTEPRHLFCSSNWRSFGEQEGMVNAESVLDILAVAQQVGDSIGSCRVEDHCALFVVKEEEMTFDKTNVSLSEQTNVILRLQPLEGLRMLAATFILDRFDVVTHGSSFCSRVDTSSDLISNVDQGTVGVVEESMAASLLQICLEEFQQSSMLSLSIPKTLNSADWPEKPACSTNFKEVHG